MQHHLRKTTSSFGLFAVMTAAFLAATAGCGQSHSLDLCGEGGAYFEEGVARYCAYVVIRSGFRCPPALRHRFDLADGAVCSDLPAASDGDLPPEVCRYFGTAECEGRPVSQPDPQDAPVVTGLSTTEISVGDPLSFFGSRFVEPEFGWTEVHFSGVYYSTDRQTRLNDVELSISLASGIDGSVTWERFGGYRVPFVPAGNRLGVFEGEVWATNHFYDSRPEASQQAERARVSLTVGPSLVVLDNRAVGDDFVADCREPSTVMLQRMSYALRVQALGFDPDQFEFVATPGLMQSNPTENAWLVRTGPSEFTFDSGPGESEYAILHRWAPAPAFSDGYLAGITVGATGTETERRIYLPFIVRPWTYPAFEVPGQIAEIAEPQVMSGCIPGGPSSVEVTYTEQRSEEAERYLEGSVFGGSETGFEAAFADTYGHRATSAFSESATAAVSLTDLTGVAASSLMTDLFSEASSVPRRTTVDWQVSADGNAPGVATTDLQLSETLAAYQDGSGAELTRFLIGLGTTVNDASPMDVANTFGLIPGRNGLVPRPDPLSEIRRPYEVTEAQNLIWSRTWGMPRSYDVQTGISMSRSSATTLTFGEALAAAQSVGEEYGWNRDEVLIQSSSDLDLRGISADVWANQFGVWYRQATRIAHQAKIVALDLCGNGSPVGDLTANETTWAPDLGIGDACPPPSNFPPAECRLGSCTR